jgi:hypothetical protein
VDHASDVKPLPKRFKRGGYHFVQIKREGPFAMYLQTSSEMPDDYAAKGDKSAYEIIRVRTIPARVAFGKEIGSYERYPSDEEWGTFGWTAIGHEAAEKKFEEVKKRFSDKSDDQVVDVAVESRVIGPEYGSLLKTYFFDETQHLFDKTKLVDKR